MNVSALEEYGLRCAVRLAALNDGETLSAPDIAEQEGLSVEYVSKFMLHLKKSDLVRTVRGMKGGFALTRAPSEISLKEVFEALRGKRHTQFSNDQSDDFVKATLARRVFVFALKGAQLDLFWNILATYIDEFTRELTLADLLKTESETKLKTEGIARKNKAHFKQLLEEEVRT